MSVSVDNLHREFTSWIPAVSVWPLIRKCTDLSGFRTGSDSQCKRVNEVVVADIGVKIGRGVTDLLCDRPVDSLQYLDPFPERGGRLACL